MEQSNAQQAVIDCIDGPVLVIACPGAGKTTTLLRRINEMIQQGIPEENILMATFTKTAATEMKNRYLEQYNNECKVAFKTIHSLCFSILKHEGLYTASDIISEREIKNFVFHQLSYGKNFIEDSYDIVKQIIGEISSVKNNYLDIEEYEANSCDTIIFQSIYNHYQEMLKETNKIDYDEMMLITEQLLRENPSILHAYQQKYQYIQCDEYQDTNPVQKNILYLLAGDNQNICVVGDDDQSIYGFRGASPDIMFEFQRDFPECQTFSMNVNYRSGQAITDISSQLIKKNQNRFEKNLVSFRGKQGVEGTYLYRDFYNRTEEMDFVLKKIRELHLNDVPYSEMAILFRVNSLAEAPMEMMLTHNIPFTSSERVQSIYDKWIFKLLCSYLFLSMGKWKQKYMNDIIAKPNKYLKVSMFKDCQYNEEQMIQRLDYILDEGKEEWQHDRAVGEIKKIFTAFPPGRFKPDTSPLEALKSLEYIGIQEAIKDRAKKRHEEVEETQLELAALSADATRFRTLKDWLRYAKKDKKMIREINEKRGNGKGVNVMTIHSAKGCEWEHVFVIDVTHNIIPHRNNSHSDEELEEERRLLYVAMTRAKDGLYVTNAGVQSVFIEELNEEAQKRKVESSNIKRPENGALFIHKKYGIGVLQGWERSATMLVRFSQNTKKFNFPDAIEDGFLTPLD